jgi:hypothetical protein
LVVGTVGNCCGLHIAQLPRLELWVLMFYMFYIVLSVCRFSGRAVGGEETWSIALPLPPMAPTGEYVIKQLLLIDDVNNRRTLSTEDLQERGMDYRIEVVEPVGAEHYDSPHSEL